MDRAVKNARDAHRNSVILEDAKAIGNVRKACCELEVPRSSFYEWKNANEKEGKAGLLRKKPIAKSHLRHTPWEFVGDSFHPSLSERFCISEKNIALDLKLSPGILSVIMG